VVTPIFGGERLDALLQRLALVGEGDLGALVGRALAMPQAMERLLATPMIRPFLPAISPFAICAPLFLFPLVGWAFGTQGPKSGKLRLCGTCAAALWLAHA
jgi:hypothetical protein